MDATKELNTNGIGLGLHICKMIVEQFGGLITWKYEWGKGISFIFLIALDDSEDSSQEKDFRCKNPIKNALKNQVKLKKFWWKTAWHIGGN